MVVTPLAGGGVGRSAARRLAVSTSLAGGVSSAMNADDDANVSFC